MQQRIRRLLILILCILVAVPAMVLAEQNLVRKVDNFVLLLDTSGSMSGEIKPIEQDEFSDDKEKLTKIRLAKDLLLAMDREIPDLGYSGAFFSFSPYELHDALSRYSPGSYSTKTERINEHIPLFGRRTDLGEELGVLQPMMSRVKNRTALIIISDGVVNRGVDPVEKLQEFQNINPGTLCYHVISFAETQEGQRTLEAITALTDCTTPYDAVSLQDSKVMKNFVRDVFYDVEGAVQVVQNNDLDNDGVSNKDDKCPATPTIYEVDEFGCPILATITLRIQFDYDKAVVKDEYFNEIEKVAIYLQDNPGTQAAVEGHTCSLGSDNYNRKLSQSRAESVRQVLIDRFNIVPDRLRAIGYGEAKPVEDNSTEDGRILNRRVVSVITGGHIRKVQ